MKIVIYLIFFLYFENLFSQQLPVAVPENNMQAIYEQVKTPYKYGLVIVPDNNSKKIDCPTVVRKNNKWYMAYIIYDGKGYETWLAESNDLLQWQTKGKIMPFSDTADWDNNQKTGYIALPDYKWGGSYCVSKRQLYSRYDLEESPAD